MAGPKVPFQWFPLIYWTAFLLLIAAGVYSMTRKPVAQIPVLKQTIPAYHHNRT